MTPPNTNYDVSVTINIIYSHLNCQSRYGCTPEIEVYQFNTNEPQPRNIYTDRSNYHQIVKKMGSAIFMDSLSINVTVTPAMGGFYLAIRDHTSCINIRRLEVLRYECATKQEGLVVFPATAVPVEGGMTVTTECMPNASPVTDMSVVCDSLGYWDGSAKCACNSGYIMAKGSDGNSYCKRESQKLYILMLYCYVLPSRAMSCSVIFSAQETVHMHSTIQHC